MALPQHLQFAEGALLGQRAKGGEAEPQQPRQASLLLHLEPRQGLGVLGGSPFSSLSTIPSAAGCMVAALKCLSFWLGVFPSQD